MWVFTQTGFISVVAKGPTGLTARARDRQSLEGLALPIIEGGGTDYPFRVELTADQWAAFLVRSAREIDYDNFKSAITRTRGNVWHDALMDVWTAMLAVTPGRRRYYNTAASGYSVTSFSRPNGKKARKRASQWDREDEYDDDLRVSRSHHDYTDAEWRRINGL